MRVLDVIVLKEQEERPVEGSSLTKGQWINVYINSQRQRFLSMDTQAEREAQIDRFIERIKNADGPRNLVVVLQRHLIQINPNTATYQAIDQAVQQLANTDPDLGPAPMEPTTGRLGQELSSGLEAVRNAVQTDQTEFATAQDVGNYIGQLVNWIKRTRGNAWSDILDGNSQGATMAITSLVDSINELKAAVPVSKSTIDERFFGWTLTADRAVQAVQAAQ